MNIVKLSVLASALFLLVGLNANAQDGNTILKKLDEVMYSPKDMTGKTKIILIDKNGKEKTREATTIQKGTDKRLFRFTSPSSQAGIATLSLPNDVMYMYLPAFGKERRISSSVKSQKFAGTDFAYEDMEAKLFVDKYTAKLLKTEGDLLVVELKPTSKKSSYSKVIAKLNKTNYCPTYMEFYDKGNRKIKTATYQFEKIGKYWNAKEITMIDLKKNHKTIMKMSNIKYDTGLTDDDFTVRKLKQ
ncbi:MAG: outer membrane lipoprotein-sorting protein [Bacteroidales bacterium]|nr:outer membrane lipoprotein-sorting protein [Bacteroidales bacterium]